MAITGSTFMKVSRAQRLDVSGHAMDRIAHHTGLHPTEALARTLQKKQIRPLSYTFAWTLYREGPEGWLKRANTLLQLASNTQQLGLVLRGEYLHLSRSLTAMVATLGGLYEGVPRYRAGADILIAVNTFPARALKEWLRGVRADRLRAAAEHAPGRLPARAPA